MATIQGVYIALFGRPADPLGLAFFNTATNGGQNLSAIGNLAATAEYQGRFAGQSNVQIINSIYQSLFNRDADLTGLTFFSNALSAGTLNINNIAIAILDGAVGSDLTTVTNKEAAANLFTTALNTGTEVVAYSGTAAADAGRAFLAGVTTTVPAATAVDAVILDIVTNPGGGTTFALTTGADNVVGTSSNDTINGLNDGAATSTLTAADVINGGAGVDTLNISVSNGVTNVLAGAQISNVEVVGIRAINSGAYELDATGLTRVNLTGTNATSTTLTNLANSATVTVGSGANLTGAIAAGYVAAATTANLAYAGGTSGAVNVTGAALTTANIASTGAANTAGAIDVAGATAINVNATTNFTATSIATSGTNSTLTVSGAAASVSVGTLAANLRTIDASGLTAGGLTATLSNAAQVVTGGAGNDVISTGSLGLLTGSVNAGAGTADRLVLTATADLDSAAKGARYTGFEVLQVSDAQTADLDNIAGITSIRIADGAGTTTVSNLSAAQAGAITVSAGDATGAITIGVKGAATIGQIDTVALTVSDGAATVGTIALGTPSIANVEKLTINAVDNYTITALTGASALDAVTLSGAATQGITFGAGAIASNFSLNGSAATGVLTVDASAVTGTNGAAITGGSAADTLTGTANADAITGGAGNDTLFGRAGADTIVGGDGNDTIQGDGVTVAAVTAVNAIYTLDFAGAAANDVGDTVTIEGVLAYTAVGADNAATIAAGVRAGGTIAIGSVTYDITGTGTQVILTAQTANATNATFDLAVVDDAAEGGLTQPTTAAFAPSTLGVVAAAATIGSGGDAAAADTLTGGAGNDAFRFVAGTSHDTVTDIITDLNLGTNAVAGQVDTLVFQNLNGTASVVALASGDQSNVTAAASLTAAAGLVANAAQADGATVQFTYGANTYVFHNVDGNGTFDAAADILVRVTGVTGTLDASDVVLI